MLATTQTHARTQYSTHIYAQNTNKLYLSKTAASLDYSNVIDRGELTVLNSSHFKSFKLQTLLLLVRPARFALLNHLHLLLLLLLVFLQVLCFITFSVRIILLISCSEEYCILAVKNFLVFICGFVFVAPNIFRLISSLLLRSAIAEYLFLLDHRSVSSLSVIVIMLKVLFE